MARLLLLGLFFVSGALGLGYQVLWSKYLLDFVGVSAYSYATVLAAFMGGLAIGSAVIGRRADRVASPLKLYAYLELGVGLYGVAYLPLSRLAAAAYASWARFGPGEGGGAHALAAKIAVAGLLLLPPTILMGGTFPALVRQATERLGMVGRRASQLYAVNALGAVIGALAMAFVSMPLLGMSASLLSLALLNGVVALLALALAAAGTRRPVAPVAPTLAESEETPAEVRSRFEIGGGLAAVLLAGFVSFLYEIAWTRYFGLVVGSSTYSFSVMLAAFISGIALGSAILIRLERRLGDAMSAFGWTQVVAGVLVVVPLPLYPYLPWVFKQLSALLSAEPAAFYVNEAGKLVLCFATMLPPALFLGMSLPLVVKGLARRVGTLASDSGRVYAWNTWGNVAGALLGGLLLLPALGTERLLRAGAVVNVAVGLAVLLFFGGAARRSRRALVATAVLAAVAALALGSPSWDPRWFMISPFRRITAAESLAATRASLATAEVLLWEDDPAANILVASVPAPGGRQILLLNNGKADASSSSDMPTQLLSAHLPLLLHPNPRQVLVVGLASGVTAGAVLGHPVERLDVVELVRSMPRAARLFDAYNRRPETDPRYHLIVDDARSVVSYTTARYDVIISEPSNPWMAGVTAMFARDFYGRALHALQPDGIYLQWLQAYDIGDATLATVLRTFRSVFPYVYGFQGCSSDLLLLGSRRPLSADPARLAAAMTSPVVRSQLESLGIRAPAQLLFYQRFSPATVDVMAAFTDEENTDDNHLLEYRAPRELFCRARPTLLDAYDERLNAPTTLLARGGATVSPTELLAGMSHPAARNPAVTRALEVATLHLRSLGIGGGGDAGATRFVDEWNVLPPERLVAAVDDMLGAGQVAAAARLVEDYRAAIGLEAVWEPRAAAFWRAHLVRWSGLAAGSGQAAAFAPALIAVLQAGGQPEAAARELIRAAGRQDDSPVGWALAQGCRISPGVCQAVMRACASADRAGVVANLASLQRSAPPRPAP